MNLHEIGDSTRRATVTAVALMAGLCSVVAFGASEFAFGGVFIAVAAILLGIALKATARTVSKTADVVNNIAFTYNPGSRANAQNGKSKPHDPTKER